MMKSKKFGKQMWKCVGVASVVFSLAACGKNECSLIRVTPSNKTDGILVNSVVSASYTAPEAGRCVVTLKPKDSSKTTAVVTSVIDSREWSNPSLDKEKPNSVAGYVMLKPAEDLDFKTKYDVVLTDTKDSKVLERNEKVISTFVTMDGLPDAEPDLNGKLVSAVDVVIPNTLGITASSAMLSASSINPVFAGSVLPGSTDPITASTGAYPALVALYNKTVGLATSGQEFENFLTSLKQQVPDLSASAANYSAHLKKVTYISSDSTGQKVNLTGLLVFPMHDGSSASNIDYTKTPVVLVQRDTMNAGDATPSSGGSLYSVVASIFASRGYIVFIPDLIGYSGKDLVPDLPDDAFVMAQDTATATHDMWFAVRSFFSQNYSSDIKSNLFYIGGASQGAYSSFAALNYLYDSKVSLKGIYGLAGPYNLYQSIYSYVSNYGKPDPGSYSEHVTLANSLFNIQRIVRSYKGFMNLSRDEDEFYSLDDTGHSVAFNPSFIDSYPSSFSDLDSRLGINSLLGPTVSYTFPKETKIVLFHRTDDDDVPFGNTSDMTTYLKGKGFTVSPGNCHESDAPYMSQLVLKDTHTACAHFFFDAILKDLPPIQGL